MFRKICAVILFSTAFITVAAAQIPTSGNVFVGYSYLSSALNKDPIGLDPIPGSRASLNGWNGSLEGKVFPLLGIVADLSGHYGSENFLAPAPPSCGPPGFGCVVNAKAKMYSVIFGPRLSVPVGKFTPFAEAMVGVSHINGSASGFSNSNTSFADALGGGIDYRIIHGLGFRFEGDLLQTRFFSHTQNNVRISTGLVLHF
jgi:hypothetical protein